MGLRLIRYTTLISSGLAHSLIARHCMVQSRALTLMATGQASIPPRVTAALRELCHRRSMVVMRKSKMEHNDHYREYLSHLASFLAYLSQDHENEA